MSVYQKSLLTRNVSIPMSQMGGDVKKILKQSLSIMEGACVEEGYMEPDSIEIFTYSCGVLKGSFASIQVVFECNIANPFAGQLFTCVVEHNTKAGIKARLQTDSESPFILFLARDHHTAHPTFSEIKEGAIIQVSVLGQRYEINDPKISIIATLIEEIKPEIKPEKIITKAKEKEKEPTQDVFAFYSGSADVAPCKGTGESGNSKNYGDLQKVVDWRKQLSHFNVAPFQCDGDPAHGISFPAGSRWNTLEHFWQASKLSLQDKDFANLLRMGEKYGDGDGANAKTFAKGLSKGPAKTQHKVILSAEQLQRWVDIKLDVMYVGAKAKFAQNPELLRVLCLTKPAKLMHAERIRAKPTNYVHFFHYERVRDELC